MAIREVSPSEFPQEYPDIVGATPEDPRAAAFRPFIPAEVALREFTPLPIIVGTLSDVFNPELGQEALRYALAASVLLYLVAAACLLAAVGSYRRKLRANAVPPAAAAAASA